MSAKKSTTTIAVTTGARGPRLHLPATHPKFRIYSGVALTLPAAAEQVMAGIVIAAAEQEDAAAYLNGIGGARALNEGNARGIQAGDAHVKTALRLAQHGAAALTPGEQADDALAKLLAEIVTVTGRRHSRMQVKQELASAQAAAARAEGDGDEGHLEPLSAGAKGWFVTAILTVLELVGVYAHLVNLSGIVTAVVLASLAAVLGAANHWGTAWLGRSIRAHRLLGEARGAANDAAMANLHG